MQHITTIKPIIICGSSEQVPILDTAAKENKIGITKLMYASRLPYRQVILHVQPLLKEQLLEYQKANKRHSITNKG